VHVRCQLPEVGAAAPTAPPRNREPRRQSASVLFQQLNAQQFFATRQ
jgi:hypothetical protein